MLNVDRHPDVNRPRGALTGLTKLSFILLKTLPTWPFVLLIFLKL